MSHFLVVIHDVTPYRWDALSAITRQLEPLVGYNLSGAVIPCWQSQPLSKFERGFCDVVRGSFGEILLHGYAHHCDGNSGWVGLLTGHVNEFTGLPESEAMERLQRGQNILAEAFGRPADGFVPPAWQWGALTPRALSACGLKYGVGLAGIYDVHGGQVPLATWSWDNGCFSPLGYVGEAAGWLMFVMSPDSLPCIVFHPADVERGFVPHGLRLIRRLLAEGRQPATFANTCLSQSLNGSPA